MSRADLKQLAVVLVLGLAAAACAGTKANRRWLRELDAADSLLDRNDFDAAEQAYLSLYERTDDRVERRYFTYRLGRLEERRGAYEAATRYYLQLMDHWNLYVGVDDWTPWGMFRLGLLLYDELDRQQEGLKIWRHVIHYFPDAEGPAYRALELLTVHFEQSGDPGEAVRFFAREYRALQHTPVGPKILYRLAYWHHTYLDDPDRAIELYTLLRERYDDNLDNRDEAEWQLVLLLHERGDYRQELSLLQQIIDQRTVGPFLGADSTSHMELASFRLGVLLLESFGDIYGAIDAFESFAEVWVSSMLRNDAILNLLYAWAKLGESERVIEVAELYLAEYPRSHRVPDVISVLEAHGGATP